MSNELVENTKCWSAFLSKNNSVKTFDQFIDFIKKLDNNTLPNTWTKWKNTCSNQVVIKTPNYFYKIYQITISEYFVAQIREKLAEIYRDVFHIKWDIFTFENENGIVYQIEQREPLKVCNESIISFDDLMLNWSKTLLLLEDKLFLPKIEKQLQQEIPNLRYVKLIRDCVNKYIDYAITDDGNIVLLDDADWFLAMIDENDDWMQLRMNGFSIITPDGERLFAPQEYPELFLDKFNGITSVNKRYNKWMLFNLEHLKNNSVDKLLFFVNQREQMIKENIKLLRTQKYLPNKLCVDITADDYFQNLGLPEK